MGFWKVLGGAVLGVGAVAAAPFTGGGSILGAATLASSLAGAGTVATAVGAAAAGAAAGAIASEAEEEEKKSEYRKGKREATAKYAVEVEKLKEALDKAVRQLKDDKKYFQLITALFAVGMATANADGEISEVELEELDEFVAGIAHSNLPRHVKETINELRHRPPNFNTAMKEVEKLGDDVDLKIFEKVIWLIANSDGYIHPNEEALLEAFRKAA